MATLERARADELLLRVRQLRHRVPGGLWDAHIHPFDVIFQTLSYRRLATQPGVWASDDAPFVPPETGVVRLRGPAVPPPAVRPAFFMLLVRRLFRHTGPAVLRAHLDLAGLEGALLLPVAPRTGSNETELETLRVMFGDDPRFRLAVSVPNTVPTPQIASFVSRAVARFRASALKLHPAVTGIDLGSAAGRERVEAILDACRLSGIPLVVHGGRSYPSLGEGAGGFAAIENLAAIRWRDAGVPVSIAHAGCYGYSLEEMRETVLPALDAMFAANDNLRADVSALEHDALALVLQGVPQERLMFGSDALYEPPWSALVKLACALEASRLDLESTLLAMAGRNPATFLSLGCDDAEGDAEAAAAAGLAPAAP